jgi:metal-sulfur cluster biosynthetic enzyme
MIDEKQVFEALKNVFDPELNFNIVDLGLVYGAQVKDGKDVFVKMTMTTPFCPYGASLLDESKAQVSKITGVGKVEIELVWEPAWGLDRVKSEVKEQLGLV